MYLYAIFCTQIKYMAQYRLAIVVSTDLIWCYTCPHSHPIETNVGRLLHQRVMFGVCYDAICCYFINLVDAYHKLQHQTKNQFIRTQFFSFFMTPWGKTSNYLTSIYKIRNKYNTKLNKGGIKIIGNHLKSIGS